MGETKRTTVSLPKDKYEKLKDELDTFSSDTARFQHLVELFLSGQLDSSPSASSREDEQPSEGSQPATEGDAPSG